MSLLAPFQAILDGEAQIDADRAVVGWVGLDIPLEVIDAAGRRPVRIRADAAVSGPAKATFGEGGGHPGMRAVVSRLMTGEDGPIERLAIGSTPVTGVWLYNLLISLGDRRPGVDTWDAVLVDLARRDAPAAHVRNIDAIRAFAEDVGAIDCDALLQAIADRNALRLHLRQVDSLRFGPSPRLTGGQARLVLDAAEVASLPTIIPLIDALLDQAPALPVSTGAPVIYSGSGGPSLAVYRALESAGLRIVGDDQDYGSRAIGPDVEESGDPFAALAERYRRRFPAPAGWTIKSRTDFLVGLARERGAQAVIFDIADYDHPAAWDLPAQTAALNEAGVTVRVLSPNAWRDPKDVAAAVADLAYEAVRG